ncbi:MAG: DMT family transporter [Planctomycetota bacterium]
MEKQKQAYLYATTVVLLWVTVASAFKISLRYLNFLQLLLYASLTSVFVLFLIILVQNKWALLKSCSKNDYLHSALLGFLNPFLYYVILFKAYELLPVQQAQPLNQTWIIVLSLLSIVILKQKIGVKHILAIIISFIGVLIISTQGKIAGCHFSSSRGVMLALASAFIWALFWIYNIKDKRDETIKLFLNFVFGFIFVLIACLVSSRMAKPSLAGLIGAVYVGVFEMGVTFVLWLKALQLSKTTAQVSNLIYLVPFLSLIVINFVLGEKILFSTVIGLFLIMGGIIIQQQNSSGNPAAQQ